MAGWLLVVVGMIKTETVLGYGGGYGGGRRCDPSWLGK